MTALAESEVIEGESRELVTVAQQPGQSIVAHVEQGPEQMIAVASRLAAALRDVVERQRLYATIQGKKYPQVEAWMTIARMDNVVAREAATPIRHDDGSYEAFCELIRLSDGMVIGSGSALCGTPDDKPWNGRSEPARRSMAVTRATSRAFRQQYSWVMALAGYEPTPAEEMPRDDAPAPRDVTPSPAAHGADGSLIGTAEVGKGQADFELRQSPAGEVLAFRLVSGRKGIKVIAKGPLAMGLFLNRDAILGKTVTCYGKVDDETFTPENANHPVTYQVLTLERLAAGDLVLEAARPALDPSAEAELDALELFNDPAAPEGPVERSLASEAATGGSMSDSPVAPVSE